MRFTLSTVFVLLLAACGEMPAEPSADSGTTDSGTTSPDASTPDSSAPLPDGSPADCFSLTYSTGEPVAAVMLGEMQGETFARYADTGHAEFEWGFQGGTMITPSIAIPPEVAGEGDCVQITLENVEDPEYAGTTEGLQEYFPAGGVDIYRLGSDGLSEPLFDQIAWDDPTGWHILLRATVRGVDFALTETVAIEIDPPSDIPAQCQALPTAGDGCLYRQIPGTAMITMNEASPSGSCPDPRAVFGIFTPTDPSHTECYTDFATSIAEPLQMYVGYDAPPSACIDDYDTGSSIPAILEVVVSGFCEPYRLQIDLPACADACI
jgi:hypothetical protein